MRIKEKINMTYEEFIEHGPITIVAFGDSVTYGAMADGVVNYNAVYWNRLREKILQKRYGIPVNVINAGIGGVTATSSLARLDSQVLIYKPDLAIICFGLNDIHDPIETYCNSLETIFNRCKQVCQEVIFMTPNMLNTYVAADTEEKLLDCAQRMSVVQNSGKMDTYMKCACETAKRCGVTICDCYSKWKELSQTQDTTMLLANRINHPCEDMHELFAQMLFDTLFVEKDYIESSGIETMYQNISD